MKDKVIVGTAGGEFGIRGFIAAYDVHTGKEVWRFYTVPGRAIQAATRGAATHGKREALPYG